MKVVVCKRSTTFRAPVLYAILMGSNLCKLALCTCVFSLFALLSILRVYPQHIEPNAYNPVPNAYTFSSIGNSFAVMLFLTVIPKAEPFLCKHAVLW